MFETPVIRTDGRIKTMEFSEEGKAAFSAQQFNFKKLAQLMISFVMGIKIEDMPANYCIVDEMENFLRTGDIEAKVDKIVCVNPSLLTLDEKLNLWTVIIQKLH